MRLAWKSAVVAGLVTAVVAGGNGAVVYEVTSADHALQQSEARAAAQHEAVARVRADFSNYLGYITRYGLAAAEAPTRVEILGALAKAAHGAAGDFHTDLATATGLLSDTPDADDLLHTVDTNMWAYIGYGEQAIAEAGAGNPAVAAWTIAQSDVTTCSRCAKWTLTLDALDRVDDAVTAGSHARLARLTSRAHTMELVAIGSGLFTLVVLVLALLAFRRSVLHPISQVRRRLTEFSNGGGDLRTRLPATDRTDEIGDLTHACNAFVSGVQGIVAEVAAGAKSLAATAQEMAALADDMADRHGELAGDITHVAGTARQVAEQVGTIAASGEDLGISIVEASQAASEAALIAAEAHDLAGRLEAGVDWLAGAHSEIAEVTESLRLAATQTSALALTAVGGAAPLGGREPRATDDVALELEVLALQTADAVSGLTSRAQAVQEMVSSAAEQIDALGAVMGRVNGHALRIAGAVAAQTAATSELTAVAGAAYDDSQFVTSTVDRVAATAAAARETSRRAEASTERLRDLAEGLGKLVERYHF